MGWSDRIRIQDHSGHGRSKEAVNLWPEWFYWPLWCTMIWVILDHWSWSRSPQRNAHVKFWFYLSSKPQQWVPFFTTTTGNTNFRITTWSIQTKMSMQTYANVCLWTKKQYKCCFTFCKWKERDITEANHNKRAIEKAWHTYFPKCWPNNFTVKFELAIV